ncbi:hypothetical protein CR513_10239, partial [Mucuna pruriens]
MPTPKIETEVRASYSNSSRKKVRRWSGTKSAKRLSKKSKQYLKMPYVLVSTVPRKPLILYLSVLEESMGGVLGAARCLRERTCHLLSQQEVHRLRTKVPNTKTNLLCSSLNDKETEIYIFKKPALTGRITRWQMALSEYDIVYVSQKAIKGSAIVEQLAHHPLVDHQPLLHEFLNEYIMVMEEETEFEAEPDEWKLWFDEASNLLGNGIGAVLAFVEEQCFPFSTRLGFDYTNNMGEEEACAAKVLMAIEH